MDTDDYYFWKNYLNGDDEQESNPDYNDSNDNYSDDIGFDEADNDENEENDYSDY